LDRGTLVVGRASAVWPAGAFAMAASYWGSDVGFPDPEVEGNEVGRKDADVPFGEIGGQFRN